MNRFQKEDPTFRVGLDPESGQVCFNATLSPSLVLKIILISLSGFKEYICSYTDQLSLDQTIISGMGELHLDIYVERIRREYKVPDFLHSLDF